MEAGRSFQLPIDIEALEKLIFPEQEVAGGGYYVIRGGTDRRNKGLHRKDFIKHSGLNPSCGFFNQRGLMATDLCGDDCEGVGFHR